MTRLLGAHAARGQTLQDGEIHVWRVCVDDVALLADGEATLSTEEHRRAETFRFERDRQRFTVRRAVLRELLGRYLDLPPADVRLVAGPFGKPALDHTHRSVTLQFNYSHSSGLGVYAFATGMDVGIDVERIRPLPEMDAIAASSFTDAERDSIDSAGEHRLDRFFQLWAAKEAVLKASGEGFSRSPASIELVAESADGFRVAHQGFGVDQWFVRTLAIAQGFAAALAIPRRAQAFDVLSFRHPE
jgi:4'-phosphopantetheinyl transferase